MSTEFISNVRIEMYDDTILVNEEHIDDLDIKWSLELEMRGWGVKSVYVHVPDQRITLNYTIYDEAGDYEIDQTKVVDLTNVQVNLEGVNWDGGLSPHTLEFYNGKISLIF